MIPMPRKKKVPTLTAEQKLAVEAEIKMMLHAHRDCLRNKLEDTTKITFDCRDGYYGEAFGILRGLAVLGYGYTHGPVNIQGEGHRNFKWWLSQLEDEVLKEEGFGGDNRCEYCFQQHGKDAVRPYTPSGHGGRRAV
jgi:hypothetical protein